MRTEEKNSWIPNYDPGTNLALELNIFSWVNTYHTVCSILLGKQGTGLAFSED
jgi:hypothetical protein